MIELKDTVNGMLSDDYKERFIAEYQQLSLRRDKLMAFCEKIEDAERRHAEPPKHDCPLLMLREQEHWMGCYMSVLETRARIEGINLD